jgi:hypothetical protein
MVSRLSWLGEVGFDTAWHRDASAGLDAMLATVDRDQA